MHTTDPPAQPVSGRVPVKKFRYGIRYALGPLFETTVLWWAVLFGMPSLVIGMLATAHAWWAIPLLACVCMAGWLFHSHRYLRCLFDRSAQLVLHPSFLKARQVGRPGRPLEPGPGDRMPGGLRPPVRCSGSSTSPRATAFGAVPWSCTAPA